MSAQNLTNHPNLWLKDWPVLNAQSHKYTRGVNLIIGGNQITGAARLAALAAARIGCGLTILLVPEVSHQIYASAMLSVMVKPFSNQSNFAHQINDTKITCYLIGPGAGVTTETLEHVLALLKTGKPVVLDADALSVLSTHNEPLSNIIKSPCVLTPHEGEFKRLFSLKDDRVESAKVAAKQSGAVVVLKGAETVIASPSGEIIVNRDAPATLATGGSGDVLAGLITGLMAQGMPAFKAAAAANWVHTQAANQFGLGLIAEDLPQMVPTVLQELLTD